ncbi:MAG: hypothetical protein K8R36_06955 [Planctomycetales bacterium]|nr:hypothetical protein [Planctomycetales bacterium]
MFQKRRPSDHRTFRPNFEQLEDRTTLSVAFFVSDDGIHGAELWKTDGTSGGTALVKDINPGLASSSPGRLTDVNGTLFFEANNGVSGWELWKSDGTPEGTVMVKDIRPGSGTSYIEFPTNLNGTLFFRAVDGVHGASLWKSDGTAAGTVLVKECNPSQLAVMNDKLYFSGGDTKTGDELWTSDGTAAGTVLLKDISKGRSSSAPQYLTPTNVELFFSADNGKNGRELWKSDGTAAGTVLVKDINPGSGSGIVGNQFAGRAVANGSLFFSADDGTHGLEAWRSDGSAAGTLLLKDIVPGINGSLPGQMTSFNGNIYFNAAGGLWKTDGTPVGTIQFLDSPATNLTPVGNTLYFTLFNSSNTWDLWKTDGTQAGTTYVTNLGPGVAEFRNLNGQLVFRATDADHGWELWTSDGTLSGTKLLEDINLGPLGSEPSSVTIMG